MSVSRPALMSPADTSPAFTTRVGSKLGGAGQSHGWSVVLLALHHRIRPFPHARSAPTPFRRGGIAADPANRRFHRSWIVRHHLCNRLGQRLTRPRRTLEPRFAVTSADATMQRWQRNPHHGDAATSTAGPFFDLLDQMEALTMTVELDWPDDIRADAQRRLNRLARALRHAPETRERFDV